VGEKILELGNEREMAENKRAGREIILKFAEM